MQNILLDYKRVLIKSNQMGAWKRGRSLNSKQEPQRLKIWLLFYKMYEGSDSLQ